MRARTLILFMLVWLACTSSCGALPPIGQVLLYIDTDAPVPAAPGRTLDGAPQPLFDTLIVDVYLPGSTTPCDGCSRTFAVDLDRFREKRVSIGIVTKPAVAGYRARARLYDSNASLDGRPPRGPKGGLPQSVIEVVTSLPKVEPTGILERTIVLETDTVGIPTGTLDEPIDPLSGPPSASRVAKWPGAIRKPCRDTPYQDEVCIPGGAFWMGNPHVRGTGQGDGSDLRRLVVLSPYFIDATEVTVKLYRRFPDDTTFRWSGDRDGNDPNDYCTFTNAESENEWMPVNCVRPSAARAFCQARGRDLPTEAQYEFVASGYTSKLFVWGDETPRCDEVVFGNASVLPIASPCGVLTDIGGPRFVGSIVQPPRRDKLVEKEGTVWDLIGNVAEWARDVYQEQEDECWSQPGVFVDPWCDGLAHSLHGTFTRVARGGSWITNQQQLPAAARIPAANVGTTDIGFRCTREDIR